MSFCCTSLSPSNTAYLACPQPNTRPLAPRGSLAKGQSCPRAHSAPRSSGHQRRLTHDPSPVAPWVSWELPLLGVGEGRGGDGWAAPAARGFSTVQLLPCVPRVPGELIVGKGDSDVPASISCRLLSSPWAPCCPGLSPSIPGLPGRRLPQDTGLHVLSPRRRRCTGLLPFPASGSSTGRLLCNQLDIEQKKARQPSNTDPAHTHMHTHTHIYPHTCTHPHTQHTYPHTITHTHMHTPTYIYIHACTHTYPNTCAHMYTCTHMLTCALAHTHMHTQRGDFGVSETLRCSDENTKRGPPGLMGPSSPGEGCTEAQATQGEGAW